MYQKYLVYLDDGKNVYKIAIAAVCEDSARIKCSGNGEIIAIKDVTKDNPIYIDKVAKALKDAEFGENEIDWICRTLTEFGIAE